MTGENVQMNWKMIITVLKRLRLHILHFSRHCFNRHYTLPIVKLLWYANITIFRGSWKDPWHVLLKKTKVGLNNNYCSAKYNMYEQCTIARLFRESCAIKVNEPRKPTHLLTSLEHNTRIKEHFFSCARLCVAWYGLCDFSQYVCLSYYFICVIIFSSCARFYTAFVS